MKVQFYCPECEKHLEMDSPISEGVYSIIMEMQLVHAKKSAGCPYSFKNFRLTGIIKNENEDKTGRQ